MRFSRTRLSDVLHAEACASSRPVLSGTTEEVAPVYSIPHPAHHNGGALLGLGI